MLHCHLIAAPLALSYSLPALSSSMFSEHLVKELYCKRLHWSPSAHDQLFYGFLTAAAFCKRLYLSQRGASLFRVVDYLCLRV